MPKFFSLPKRGKKMFPVSDCPQPLQLFVSLLLTASLAFGNTIIIAITTFDAVIIIATTSLTAIAVTRNVNGLVAY